MSADAINIVKLADLCKRKQKYKEFVHCLIIRSNAMTKIEISNPQKLISRIDLRRR